MEIKFSTVLINIYFHIYKQISLINVVAITISTIIKCALFVILNYERIQNKLKNP